jgi:protein-S-isoprenylcysteine O-methyltransferase Ste14
MRPLPFTELPAGIAFVVALMVFVGVQVAASRGTFRGGGWRRYRGEGTDRGSLFVVIATGGVGVAIAAILATKARVGTIAPGDPGDPGIRWAAFVLGLAAIVGGSALREWAVLTLGTSFTFDVRVASGQHVVTSGPYRLVRHPSYTGLLLSFAGLGLAFGNWICLLVIVVLPTAGLVYRIGVEEAALRGKLGVDYERFASGRKRLVPGIW